MKKVYGIVVAALLLVGTAASVSAQSGPGSGFVLGVETGQTLGAAALYQINDMIQVGSGVGLQVGDNTYVYLSPQARFLFALSAAQLYFVASAELQLLFGDRDATGLAIKAALQYWIARNVALYGGVGFLSVQFDPSVFGIGLLTPHVGAQFSFN